MLNAHTKIFWAGEIFEKYMRAAQNKTLNDFVSTTVNSSRNKSVSSIYGFETKYLAQQHLSEHCLNLGIGDYIQLLRILGFSYFIVLHRKNYLRRAISIQVAKETMRWHSKEITSSPTRVFIDVHSFRTGSLREPLVDLFARIDESYERLRHSLPGNSLLLTYEEDIQESPLIAYKKVCDFLDVADEAPAISLRRTNPFTYEQMVENFEEVEAVLKDTKYSWMLDK
jgi:LPS sulfotransferase NodH